MDGGQDDHHVEDELEDEVEDEEEGLRRVCRKNGAPKKKRQKKSSRPSRRDLGICISVFTFPKNNVSVLLKQNV